MSASDLIVSHHNMYILQHVGMYIPKTQVIFVHHSNEYSMYVVFGLHMRVEFCQLKDRETEKSILLIHLPPHLLFQPA